MGSSSHGGERKGQLGPAVTVPMSGTHLNRDERWGPHMSSSDNLADLFTKPLPTTTFKKLVHQIGMRRLKDLQNEI